MIEIKLNLEKLFVNEQIPRMSFSFWECTPPQKDAQPFRNQPFFKKLRRSMIGFKKRFRKRKNVFATRLVHLSSSNLV